MSRIAERAPTDMLWRIRDIVGSVNSVDMMYGHRISISPDVMIEWMVFLYDLRRAFHIGSYILFSR